MREIHRIRYFSMIRNPCVHQSLAPTGSSPPYPIQAPRSTSNIVDRLPTSMDHTNLPKVKRWRENWDEYAWPLFSKLGRRRIAFGGGGNGGNGGSRSGGGCGGGGAGAGVGGGGGRGRNGGGVFAVAGEWSARVLAESVVVPAVVLLILLVSVPWLSSSLESWAVDSAAVVDRLRRQFL